MITLRQLRYLTSLARHRHFGRAAAGCAVTQPALSMQIRELEREVGAELVERRPHEIVLTGTGIEVARRAEQILAAAHDLVGFARHCDVLGGPLKLGVIPTLAPYVLPHLLPLLGKRHPRLRLEVRETQTRVLVDDLAACELDCVMLALPVERADIETHKLFDDTFLLAVPAGDAMPGRGRVKIDDIDQRRLILLEEGHCLRDQALAICASNGREQPAGLGATSLTTVMQMVANGLGVTFLPEVAAKTEVRDGRVRTVRFCAPEPARAVGLAWRRTSPRKKDFLALGAVVKEAVAASARPRRAAQAS